MGNDDPGRRPIRSWAGLRSFVADGDLVEQFRRASARLSGWQLRPLRCLNLAAMGEACAALVRGLPLPERIAGCGLSREMLSRSRKSLRASP